MYGCQTEKDEKSGTTSFLVSYLASFCVISWYASGRNKAKRLIVELIWKENWLSESFAFPIMTSQCRYKCIFFLIAFILYIGSYRRNVILLVELRIRCYDSPKFPLFSSRFLSSSTWILGKWMARQRYFNFVFHHSHWLYSKLWFYSMSTPLFNSIEAVQMCTCW